MIRFPFARPFEPGIIAIAFSATVWAVGVLAGEIAFADDPDVEAFRRRTLSLLAAFEVTPETEAAAKEVEAATMFREVDAAALPLTVATIGINPEGRVKIASAPDRVDLIAGQPRRFLVRVENLAGVTAPLRLRGLDLASSDAGEAKWMQLRFVDSVTNEPSLATVVLDGTTDQYLAVELLVADPGVREIRLVADAGQGTQDLGFRAVADVQIRTSSAADLNP